MEAQLLTQQSSQGKEYPIRYVGVVFGNPRSEECAGFGICKMEDEGPFPPIPPQKRAVFTGCPRYQATVERVEATDGTIYLSFSVLKKALAADIVTKYFSETHFIVGSALHLPNSLTKAFDMADPSVLKAGLYAIIDKKTYFQILIQTT
jgi:hypothetical protein